MRGHLTRGLLIGTAVAALFLAVSCGKPPAGKDGLPDLGDDKPPVEKDKGGPAPAKAGSYLFCFWNVENLFDDVDDGRKSKGDPEFDSYFGSDPEALKYKLKHLVDVLVPLNGGRGPDILGVAEVESERAAQLLADALNKRLGKEEYKVVFEKITGVGRAIVPALITRLPVVKNRTDVWGKRKRILKTVIRVDGHDLIVVVSHWTSRVTDRTGASRAGYADTIYGEYKAAYLAARKQGKNLDFVLCGDFNDNPDDPSVTEHLHAIGDLAKVKASKEEPLLFDLSAKPYLDGKCTVEGRGKKNFIFDHLCVSPGMLDDVGWSCEVDSFRIVDSFANKKGWPNRFGGKNDKRPYEVRGASDHFPVAVRLRVR
jgi:endonuclease/exonuclease/phosphatase family metal-dependent hydrolase